MGTGVTKMTLLKWDENLSGEKGAKKYFRKGKLSDDLKKSKN